LSIFFCKFVLFIFSDKIKYVEYIFLPIGEGDPKCGGATYPFTPINRGAPPREQLPLSDEGEQKGCVFLTFIPHSDEKSIEIPGFQPPPSNEGDKKMWISHIRSK
jgi:hypothetical protein